MKIHFATIVRGVMQGLAPALLKKGCVAGSDNNKIFDLARSDLRAAGPDPRNGWHPARLRQGPGAVTPSIHAEMQMHNPRPQAARVERHTYNRLSSADSMNGFAYPNTNRLLMSSANADGADMLTFAKQVTGNNLTA